MNEIDEEKVKRGNYKEKPLGFNAGYNYLTSEEYAKGFSGSYETPSGVFGDAEKPDTTEVKVEDNKCIVRANAKNKLGSFILYAEYNNNTYSKEISVVPFRRLQ